MSDSPVLLGAVAHDPRQIAAWEGLRENLREQAVALDYALFSTYERLAAALLGGHLDAALVSSLAFVRIHRRSEGRSRAVAVRDVDRECRSKIVVGRDAGIVSLADLEGKVVAVGGRDSPHARILPAYFLAQGGVDTSKMELLPFETDPGKHGDPPAGELDVLGAVQDGRAQAGVVGEHVWAAEESAGRVDPSRVGVLWTTPAYHRAALTVLAVEADARVEPLARALFAMTWKNPKHRRTLDAFGMRQWVPARAGGFASAEAAVAPDAP